MRVQTSGNDKVVYLAGIIERSHGVSIIVGDFNDLLKSVLLEIGALYLLIKVIDICPMVFAPMKF